DELKTIADSLGEEIEEIDGITGVHHTMSDMQKEVQFNIDRDEADEHDITESQIRNQLDTFFMDQRIADIELDNRDTPVILKSTDKANTLKELKGLNINVSPEGKEDKIDLEKLIDIEEVQVPQQVEHKD